MPPQTSNKKLKVVESAPVESKEYVPYGEHERLLSIFVSGKFTPAKECVPTAHKTPQITDSISFIPNPLGAGSSLTSQGPESAVADGLSAKRSTTPTIAAGKRVGTPSRKETDSVARGSTLYESGSSAPANGSYTNFTFSGDLQRPFFSLVVPGIKVIGGGQPPPDAPGGIPDGSPLPASGSGALPPSPPPTSSGGRAPTRAQQPGPQSAGQGSAIGQVCSNASAADDKGILRILPRADQVNPDGSFKIELYRKKLQIDSRTVDEMLCKRFKFSVHTVPDLEKITAKYASAATVNEGSPLPSSGQAVRKGGAPTAANTNNNISNNKTTNAAGISTGGNSSNSPTQQAKGGASGGKHATSKSAAIVNPVELTQDPSTVQWSDCDTVVTHSFDLSNILNKNKVDRIVLAGDGQQYGETTTLSQQQARPLPVDASTEATRATLLRHQERRTLLFQQEIRGFDGLMLSIVCSEPLLSPSNIRRYMPMVIDVESVTNIPLVGAEAIDLRHTMSPREDEMNFSTIKHRGSAYDGPKAPNSPSETNSAHHSTSLSLSSASRGDRLSQNYAPIYMSVSGLDVQFNPTINTSDTPPNLTNNGGQQALPPSEAGRGGDMSFVTMPKSRGRDVYFNERFIIFLYKYSRQGLREYFFSQPLKFCLHDRDVANSSTPHVSVSSSERAVGSDKNPTSATPAFDRLLGGTVINSHFSSFGVTTLSLRNALLGDTFFSLKEQLVPMRAVGMTYAVATAGGDVIPSTPPLTGGLHSMSSPAAGTSVADYLSNATTIKASVSLLAPLPRAHYISAAPEVSIVNRSKGTLSDTRHLSRALFVFPYRAPHSQRLLQGLMGALLKFPRASGATGDITELPPPEEVSAPPRPPSAQRDEEQGAAGINAVGRKSSQQHMGKASGAPPTSPPASAAATKGGKKAAVEEKEPPTAEEEQKLFEETLPPVVDDVVFTVPEGVSGFEVIDGEFRVVVIESYPSVLHELVEAYLAILGPAVEVDPSLASSTRVLFNTDLAFPQRGYSEWPPLLKPMPELEARLAAMRNASPRSKILGGFGGVSEEDSYVHNEQSSTAQAKQHGGKGSQSESSSSLTSKTKAGTEAPKKTAKPPKLTAAQKQAIAEAEAAEQLRIEKEREAAAQAEAEAEAKRRLALGGDRDELDGGGVGNRIRRIRISRRLTELAGQQRNFMRKFMSQMTLSCISKLVNLRSTPSIAHAVDHDYFPTAQEIIELERSQGDTLEVFDICGSETYRPFEKEMQESAIIESNKAQQMASQENARRRSERKLDIPASELLSRGLNITHVGRMLFFIGTPAHPSHLSNLPKLTSEYFPRHPHKNYMLVDGVRNPTTGGPLYVLCCYPGPPPTQLLRYYCNGQVVAALERADSVEQVPILFILHAETVARNGSDDRNPAYEEHLRKMAKRASYKEFKRITAQKRAHHLATHRPKSEDAGSWSGRTTNKLPITRGGGDSDEEDAEGFVDPPPFAHDDAEDKERLLENLTVENDYVTLNLDTAETLRKWGKPASEKPRHEREALAAQYEHCRRLYDAQTARLAAVESRVSSSVDKAKHPKAFVSGSARTSDEARKHPKSIGSHDTINVGPWQDPKATTYRDDKNADSSDIPSRVTHPHPMSFSNNYAGSNGGDSGRLPPIGGGIKQATAEEEERAHEEMRRKDRDEWNSRLVVDSPHFSVNTRRPRDKPLSSIDQYQSILEGEPKKPSIKKNYAPPPPPSIRTVERVVPLARVEPYDSKHPENHTFYVAKTGVPHEFLGNTPYVTDEERAASPLYRTSRK